MPIGKGPIINLDLQPGAVGKVDEMRTPIAELRVDVGDLSELLSDFENMELETAVCAAQPIGDNQVGLASPVTSWPIVTSLASGSSP
jgi:hypothetical protein